MFCGHSLDHMLSLHFVLLSSISMVHPPVPMVSPQRILLPLPLWINLFSGIPQSILLSALCPAAHLPVYNVTLLNPPPLGSAKAMSPKASLS